MSRTPKRTPAARSLEQLLAPIKGPKWKQRVRFLERAREYVESFPRGSIPFAKRPETARMVIAVDDLHREITSGGLGAVFEDPIGDHYDELLVWLGRIGARESRKYLARGKAWFPGKSVPRNTAKRQRQFARIMERWDAKGVDPEGDLVRAMNEAVIAEIPDCLRRFLRTHREKVVRELETAERPAHGRKAAEVLRSDDDYIRGLREMRDWSDKHDPDNKRPPLPIGSVVELPTRQGFAYLQATHDHALASLTGPVVRVLKGIYGRRPTRARLRALVNGPTVFHATYGLPQEGDRESSRKRVPVIVGAFPIPKRERIFPPFLSDIGQTRDGRTGWGIWKGGDDVVATLVSPLSDEHRAWPQLLPSSFLADSIAKGWRPEMVVDAAERPKLRA